LTKEEKYIEKEESEIINIDLYTMGTLNFRPRENHGFRIL
jgi:hypothetical protein